MDADKRVAESEERFENAMAELRERMSRLPERPQEKPEEH